MMDWHMPLDPSCPGVQRLYDMLDDPMTRYSGVGDDIAEDFERKHRTECERCQEFGAENIEVI